MVCDRVCLLFNLNISKYIHLQKERENNKEDKMTVFTIYGFGGCGCW